MMNRLRGEARAIVTEAVQLAWYMRGGIQYEALLEMSHAEKEIVKDFIKSHMEAIKKHPFPVY